MKFDLLTSVGVAIAGIIIAFFVTNLVLPPLEDFSFKAIDDSANAASANNYNYADLTNPDNEVFNYDALNPTVEVYVGECEEYDSNGACVEQKVSENGEDEEGAADEGSVEGEEGIESSKGNQQENE